MELEIEEIKSLIEDKDRSNEVKELHDLIDFINYDRAILLLEIENLNKKIEESPWKIKYFEMQDLLTEEKSKNYELSEKIKGLEEKLKEKNQLDSNDSIETTEKKLNRSTTLKKVSVSPAKTDRKVNQSKSPKKVIRKASSFSISPEKPPSGTHEKVSSGTKSKTINNVTLEIKNNLAKAIDEAHKTLFYGLHHKNQSNSPSLSSTSSRYSTPTKQKLKNISISV